MQIGLFRFNPSMRHEECKNYKLFRRLTENAPTAGEVLMDKGMATFHNIEFQVNLVVDVECPRQQRLTTTLIRKMDRVRAETKPYVIEGEAGPVEVADLVFEDGTVTRRIRFAWFRFVEQSQTQ
jgi:hypothetical protein